MIIFLLIAAVILVPLSGYHAMVGSVIGGLLSRDEGNPQSSNRTPKPGQGTLTAPVTPQYRVSGFVR